MKETFERPTLAAAATGLALALGVGVSACSSGPLTVRGQISSTDLTTDFGPRPPAVAYSTCPTQAISS
jgi:hypothetical protein